MTSASPGQSGTRENERWATLAGARCSCGFIEVADADETIGDHLFEVLAPDDDKGADGHVHLEGIHCT